MSISDIRVFIGQVWGKTSTVLLALGVAVLTSPYPPPDWVKSYMFWIGAAVAVLRLFAKEAP